MNKQRLHIDIETYSGEDIKDTGAYVYGASVDAELLLFIYAINDEPVEVVDVYHGEVIPQRVLDMMYDPDVTKKALNAAFERWMLKQFGYEVPLEQWECTQVKALYCGLPAGLGSISKALKLGEFGKLATGKALIKKFCCPIAKPKKKDGYRNRNFPHHFPEDWEEFKLYGKHDVIAERKIDRILEKYIIPDWEKELYYLDQRINDRGVRIDRELAAAAHAIDNEYKAKLKKRFTEITGIEKPGSLKAVKAWIGNVLSITLTSLNKDNIPQLLDLAEGTPAFEVLEIRQRLAKTSTAKYPTMLNWSKEDGRARGMMQHYGAGRTGRWAGRGPQPHNLPKNSIEPLDDIRHLIRTGTYAQIEAQYPDISFVLSQLLRTVLIADPGYVFCISDYRAIEAAVLAWIAGEEWRLEVFRGHGKIYEASASAMFGVPLEDIAKDSPLRARGKICELALGYGGGVGALTVMEVQMKVPEDQCLSRDEKEDLKRRWRKASPAIVQFWYDVEAAAKRALRTGKTVSIKNGQLRFKYDGQVLRIRLPSGRCLFYYDPKFGKNKFGGESILYKGSDPKRGPWVDLDTYGGKLTENIVQAIARDILANALTNLENAKFTNLLHVHDEVVAKVRIDIAETELKRMFSVMEVMPSWCEDLPLACAGEITPYFKK